MDNGTKNFGLEIQLWRTSAKQSQIQLCVKKHTKCNKALTVIKY